MPVDQRTFAAEIASWVTEYLNGNPHLPFEKATVGPFRLRFAPEVTGPTVSSL